MKGKCEVIGIRSRMGLERLYRLLQQSSLSVKLDRSTPKCDVISFDAARRERAIKNICDSAPDWSGVDWGDDNE